jgi:hypothetical protein
MTDRQLGALIRWRAQHGRTWREDLRRAWITGLYAGSWNDRKLLEQIRDRYGYEFILPTNTRKRKQEKKETRKRKKQKD